MGLCLQKTSRNTFSKWCASIWQEFGAASFPIFLKSSTNRADKAYPYSTLPGPRHWWWDIKIQLRFDVKAFLAWDCIAGYTVTCMKCDLHPCPGETVGIKCPTPLSQRGVKQFCSECVITTSPYTTALLSLDHIQHQTRSSKEVSLLLGSSASSDLKFRL